MTASPTPAAPAALPDLRGPRHLTAPACFGTSGPEVVALAASAGLHLDPWEVDALEVALGERADGRWAAREVGLIVPRQNGKGSVLEALELGALFLFERDPDDPKPLLVLHSAHEFKTAAEAYLRVKSLIENTPDLLRHVKAFHNAHGSEGIELHNGNRLRFVARTSGSGRGFSADLIILDEAFNLSARSVSALLPTLAARFNPQIWYTSSAPLDDEPSAVLRRLCRRGRAGSPTLAFLEYCADDSTLYDVNGDRLTGPELDAALVALSGDRAALADANPGYPFRIDDDAVELERAGMSPEDYARERLGIWDAGDVDVEQVIAPGLWKAAGAQASVLTGAPTLALEVSDDRGWSVFAAAGASQVAPGDVHGELVDYRPGTGWVVDRAVELFDRWKVPVHIAKGSPAASFVKDLTDADVTVVEVTVDEQARNVGRFVDRVTNGTFHHRNEGALDAAVRGAVTKPTAEAVTWSRRRSTVDVGPLVAVTNAAGAYSDAPPVDLLTQIA